MRGDRKVFDANERHLHHIQDKEICIKSCITRDFTSMFKATIVALKANYLTKLRFLITRIAALPKASVKRIT